MVWENPAFKDHKNGGQIPFYKIFGQKNKGKGKHGRVNQQKIEELLKEKVPFLQKGRIVNMVSTNYRNGVMLKIDFSNPDEETLEDRLYLITARYKPKKNHIEIISLK